MGCTILRNEYHTFFPLSLCFALTVLGGRAPNSGRALAGTPSPAPRKRLLERRAGRIGQQMKPLVRFVAEDAGGRA